MKYLKMLGLAAIAAAALMAFIGAGTASATTLTGTGCTGTPSNHCAVGTVIEAENVGHVTLHPPIGSITCKTSTVAGATTNTGGSTETVQGNITALTFSDHAGKKCNDGNATVTVLKNGTLEIHTEFETTGEPATSHQKAASTNNGTLTSSGTEVTVVYLGFHCIFKTNNTDVGTVTGSANTGGSAIFDIKAIIPRTGGTSGAFCGAEAEWTGSYKITKPTSLNID